MTDLRERFRSLDSLEPPDVWRRSKLLGPRFPEPEPPAPIGRRIAALALSTAAVGLVILLIATLTPLGRQERPTRTQSALPGALPSDPCRLLTESQIGTATGGRVTSRRRLTPGDLQSPSPGAPLPCAYATDSRFGTILVTTDPTSTAAYVAARDRDPANTQILSALGDEAFAVAKSAIWVKVGSGYFSIGAQRGAGDRAVGLLHALAREALGVGTGPTGSPAPPRQSLVIGRGPSMSGIDILGGRSTCSTQGGSLVYRSPWGDVSKMGGARVSILLQDLRGQGTYSATTPLGRDGRTPVTVEVRPSGWVSGGSSYLTATGGSVVVRAMGAGADGRGTWGTVEAHLSPTNGNNHRIDLSGTWVCP